MAAKTAIEQSVERVVSQVLESHVPQLREEMVRRVLQELQPHPGASSGASPSSLLTAVSAIHAGTTQRDVLRALLDSAIGYCGRVALFVLKAGAASGWQGRALQNNDAIKDFTLDVNTAVVARALQGRTPATGNASEMDPRFTAQFGAPADPAVLVLPLMLKEKVAALAYADGGVEAGGKLDAAALELLVVATSAWLEVIALRKQAQREALAETSPSAAEKTAPPVAVREVSSYADPFAGHAPQHAAAETSPAPPDSATAAVEGAPAEAAAAAAPDEFSGMPPENAEVHRKAQRFAKLLVDEIKLYNQAKVAEGRKNKDLYDRLREDVEKSRATYQKRYGGSVAATADYFHNELIRSLAEDDISVMGAHYRR